MQGGDPPDSFQVHGGAELVDTWVKTGLMESLTSLFQREGLMSKFPKDLINIVSHQGNVYSVPVNVHRGNVLWFNKKIFDENKLTAQFTAVWNEFLFAVTITNNPAWQPITVALQNLAGSQIVEWNVQMAGALKG